VSGVLARMSRECYEDLTRKLLLWNSSLNKLDAEVRLHVERINITRGDVISSVNIKKHRTNSRSTLFLATKVLNINFYTNRSPVSQSL